MDTVNIRVSQTRSFFPLKHLLLFVSFKIRLSYTYNIQNKFCISYNGYHVCNYLMVENIETNVHLEQPLCLLFICSQGLRSKVVVGFCTEVSVRDQTE